MLHRISDDNELTEHEKRMAKLMLTELTITYQSLIRLSIYADEIKEKERNKMEEFFQNEPRACSH